MDKTMDDESIYYDYKENYPFSRPKFIVTSLELNNQNFNNNKKNPKCQFLIMLV